MNLATYISWRAATLTPSREGNVNSSDLLEFRLRTVRKDSANNVANRKRHSTSHK
ncbi:hypothetical protein FD35_GL001299 [Furfurilactobacillus rossiae DSM 15814]|uniref:Uncharacterized protein n=1 Tax=Furfurilactobacillus rossiae DSM 15814 TaxID=1114972 RepID=A0A0R1RDP9_9LACO|nr:hypothetical protein FD35_GL001299 [Furfurilactobacillus rossiae DSM 15814]